MKNNLIAILNAVVIVVIANLSTLDLHAEDRYYIDARGVIREKSSNTEVSFFGCNYTLPFAHAYRAVERLGIDHKQAIDQDVYHMTRMGLNAYRIHIWDVEMSDREGGLVQNRHLDLLDYLLAKLKERGFASVITLQTNGENGYPETKLPTPSGFAADYERRYQASDSLFIAKQKRYVTELLGHVNPYTGTKYGDDESILGLEINNEPWHSGDNRVAYDFVKGMIETIRATGCTKPIFYNISQNPYLTEAILSAGVDGITCQWYPTGLVSNTTRKGNFLPNVDFYSMPFDTIPRFNQVAKIIYEFDCADVLSSYLYPAMVRSLKGAGFQWATQFSYDPMCLADVNTEYQTHYLNLAYTPSKSIGMLIASRAMKEIPIYTKQPKYPADTLFGNVRVSYAQDLTEYISDDSFYYSNNTDSSPLNTKKLTSLAGCGSSPLVEYNGTGAYFLDKLKDGVWRLEVMPDVIITSDPFFRASPLKKVARIIWNSWNMDIRLPDVGKNFRVKGINSNNSYSVQAVGTTARIKPGTFLIYADRTDVSHFGSEVQCGRVQLGDYVAPEEDVNTGEIFVNHVPSNISPYFKPLTITAEVACKPMPDRVSVYAIGGSGAKTYKMAHSGGYNFEAIIPAEQMQTGQLHYYIVVERGGQKQTYPEGLKSAPGDWNFYGSKQYTTRVIGKSHPIILFSASENTNLDVGVISSWGKSRVGVINRDYIGSSPLSKSRLIGHVNPGKDMKIVSRVYIGNLIRNMKNEMGDYSYLVIKSQNVLNVENILIGFVSSLGLSYEVKSASTSNFSELKIPISSLRLTETSILPNQYPSSFSVKSFMPDVSTRLDLKDIEFLSLTINCRDTNTMSYALEGVWLE